MGTMEKHLRVQELATLWGVSRRTIKRLFENEPGVVRLGKGAEVHKRSYFVLLIPSSVAMRVYERYRNTRRS